MYGILITLCLLGPAASLLALHWFPWPIFLGGELPRLAAYSVGMFVVVGIPTLACILAYSAGLDGSPLMWAGLYVASMASGGVSTVLAYAVDHGRPLRRRPLGREDVDGQGGREQ